MNNKFIYLFVWPLSYVGMLTIVSFVSTMMPINPLNVMLALGGGLVTGYWTMVDHRVKDFGTEWNEWADSVGAERGTVEDMKDI